MVVLLSRGICGSEFERCPMDQIQFLTTPRVLRLLDVLRKFRPLVDDPADSSSSQVEGALCGIIFVARRTSANLLCHLLSVKKEKRKILFIISYVNYQYRLIY